MRWVGVVVAEKGGTGGRERGDRGGGAFSLFVDWEDWEEDSWLEDCSGLIGVSWSFSRGGNAPGRGIDGMGKSLWTILISY